jgi:glucokinase
MTRWPARCCAWWTRLARSRRGAQSITAAGVSSCGPFVLNEGLVELAAPNICGGLAGPARGLPNDWHSALLEAPLRQRFASIAR